MDENWHVFANILVAGKFCLVSYWLTTLFPVFHHTQPLGTFAQWVSVLFGHFPAAF
jgi:hypothetical protein